MAKCSHCSAPLPANTNLCKYCGARNDVDLRASLPYAVEQLVSERICPNCDTALQTVKLNLAQPFSIERCTTCYGLFFDPGEVETLLENSVSNVFDINTRMIDNINTDRFLKNQPIRYVKCPQCRVLMNRVNFGRRSGVVVDQCKIHGVWLDSGELTHLLEWKKAGGELLQQQTALQTQQQRHKQRVPLPYTDKETGGVLGKGLETDLLEALISAFEKLTG